MRYPNGWKTFGLAAALLVAGAASLRAAEDPSVKRGTPRREGASWIQQATCQAPAKSGGRLVVRADLGSVRVQPGADNQMSCRISLRAFLSDRPAALRLLASYQLGLHTLPGGDLSLTGRFAGPSSHHSRLSVTYEIQVPLQFNLDLSTRGGELRVAQLQGTLKGVTAGGDIRTGDVSGPVDLTTAGGDIRLGNIGARLEATTAGGGIRVGDVQGDAVLETRGGEIRAGRIAGTVTARTAGGDIILEGASGPVRAQTAGGQIRIGQCDASIRALTAGGSIHLQGARGLVDAQTAGGNIDLFRMEGAVRASTAAGRILAEINASPKTFAPSQLTTTMGDVQVYLPPDLPLTIKAAIAQAFGHKIVSDFPLRIQNEQESFRQRSQSGEAQVNGGGDVLRIRTVMGNIEIRKLDPRTLQELQKRQQELVERLQESRKALEQMRQQQQEMMKRWEQQNQPPHDPGSED